MNGSNFAPVGEKPKRLERARRQAFDFDVARLVDALDLYLPALESGDPESVAETLDNLKLRYERVRTQMETIGERAERERRA